MKKSCLLFLVNILISSLVTGQTVSDSLYNTKFYPVHEGKFILIGSEKPGSYRKSVIRLYNSDLNVIKEIKQKKARSSDIFLDEILPNEYRIVDRYRWNKGRVKIFDTNLELKSSVFFKRDDYKDWTIKTDEAPGYPLRNDEHLFGLDPIFYSDSLCYYYNKKLGIIDVSRMNFSNIKPVFIPVVSCSLDLKGDILQYKFKELTDGKVAFFYVMNVKGIRQNFIKIIDLKRDRDCNQNTWQVDAGQDEIFYLSDFYFDSDILVTAGSYIRKEHLNQQVQDSKIPSMSGFYMKAYELKDGSMTEIASLLDTNYLTGEKNISGFKVHALEFSSGYIKAIFEKMIVYKKSAVLNGEKSEYFVYESPTFIKFNYILNENDVFREEFTLNYNPDSLTELKDKQWKTFQNKKGQGIEHLIFNHEDVESSNELNIKYANHESVIFTNRNSDIFKAQWSTYDYSCSMLNRNSDRSMYYFLDGCFIKHSQTEAGFKLEKVKY